ncbi:MAG: hypothetical protein JW798_15315 [Prolixibacteraceae bacterium]|nr:hypothetical protein [Prolixibacteraceae bacterium]
MTVRKKWLILLLSVFIGVTFLSRRVVSANTNVTLYTTFTKISVPPGESIDYPVDVINKSGEIQNVDLSVTGIPYKWEYSIKSGGWEISQISVLPGEKKSFTLKVEIPFKVNKGNYQFKLLAGDSVSLLLGVRVTEKGSSETSFSVDQPNMMGNSKSTFNYRAKLNNRTAEKQLYAITADYARGWNVSFKVSGKQVTSVELEPNSTKDVYIEVNPPSQVEAGTYQIPVHAVSNNTSASLNLEAVVSGSYDVELTTPTGLLSSKITAGDEKQIELQIKNTGTSPLKDVKITASAPANWSVEFDTKKIDEILAGEKTSVMATLKADKKAIPGDYIVSFNAQTPEASSKASFRVAVRTSMLWGWIGILIIAIALGSVFILFRKYGRR